MTNPKCGCLKALMMTNSMAEGKYHMTYFSMCHSTISSKNGLLQGGPIKATVPIPLNIVVGKFT